MYLINASPMFQLTISHFLNNIFWISLYLKLNTIWHINISMKHYKSTYETHNCLCLVPPIVATYALAFLPTYLHMFCTWPNIYLTTYSPPPHLLCLPCFHTNLLTYLLTYLPTHLHMFCRVGYLIDNLLTFTPIPH
jgi:hypothetical protein